MPMSPIHLREKVRPSSIRLKIMSAVGNLKVIDLAEEEQSVAVE